MVSVPQSRATPSPRSRARLRSAVVPTVAMLLVGSGVALASHGRRPAAERPSKTIAGYYQMPFPCGQAWTGTTRSSHSPSSKAIDWNRPDDDGDDVVSSGPGTVTDRQQDRQDGLRPLRPGHPCRRRVDALRPPELGRGRRRRRPSTRAPCSATWAPPATRRARTCTTNSGSAARSRTPIFGGVKFAYGSTADLGQLRRRAPGRQHDRWCGRRARRLPAGAEVHLPGPAAGRGARGDHLRQGHRRAAAR